MELILIRGLPGSGKTTLARQMVAATDYHHVEADMFFELTGSYVFDASKLKQAHDWCFSSARHALQDGESVIVSNTFTRKWEMQPYIDLAQQFGAKLSIVEATGNWQNVHGVPQEAIDRMRQRWEKI